LGAVALGGRVTETIKKVSAFFLSFVLKT